jgi:transcriptional regulator with XRE-family HTH domain
MIQSRLRCLAEMAKVELQERFGERVRKLRQSQGLSQEELAFKAGVHRTYLGGIERGERNPSLNNIASIARALDVPLSELFSFRY